MEKFDVFAIDEEEDGDDVSVFNRFKISSLGFNWLFTLDCKTDEELVELTDEVEHVEDEDENEFEDW